MHACCWPAAPYVWNPCPPKPQFALAPTPTQPHRRAHATFLLHFPTRLPSVYARVRVRVYARVRVRVRVCVCSCVQAEVAFYGLTVAGEGGAAGNGVGTELALDGAALATKFLVSEG
jgi:hypothetical protein